MSFATIPLHRTSTQARNSYYKPLQQIKIKHNKMFPALKPVHRWHCITVSWKTHTHPELTICLETYFCSFFSFGDQQTAEGEREIRKMGEKEDDDVQQRQVRFESRFTVCGMHQTNSTTRMAKFLIRVISSSPITTPPHPPHSPTHTPLLFSPAWAPPRNL